MQINFLFRLAEQQHLTQPEDLRQPQRCPICGSIDISAGGVCRHCDYELEVFYDAMRDTEEAPLTRAAC